MLTLGFYRKTYPDKRLPLKPPISFRFPRLNIVTGIGAELQVPLRNSVLLSPGYKFPMKISQNLDVRLGHQIREHRELGSARILAHLAPSMSMYRIHDSFHIVVRAEHVPQIPWHLGVRNAGFASRWFPREMASDQI